MGAEQAARASAAAGRSDLRTVCGPGGASEISMRNRRLATRRSGAITCFSGRRDRPTKTRIIGRRRYTVRKWIAAGAILAGAVWVTIACQNQGLRSPSAANTTGGSDGKVVAQGDPSPA